jgi:hypothetical protein
MQNQRLELSLGDDVLHDVWDENYPEAPAAHEPSQHVIVGELIGDGFNVSRLDLGAHRRGPRPQPAQC